MKSTRHPCSGALVVARLSWKLLLWALCGSAPPVLSAGTLISTGAVWKYLDNGADQGTAWRGTNFDDNAWASGPAQLGYGEGDEATLIRSNRADSTRILTTYFRKAFPVTHASTLTNLMLQLLRDDGGVVYLNGIEIFRSATMSSSGPIQFDTLAINPGENSIDVTSVNHALSLLVEGTNLIAVEIHQLSTNSDDISFDLQLVGTDDNAVPTVALLSPAHNSTFHAPTEIVIQASAIDTDGTVTLVEFYCDGVKIGEDKIPPYTFAWTHLILGTFQLTARATDDFGGLGTSAPVRVIFTDAAHTKLIPTKAVWKYLDNGSDQGTAWRETSFDDGDWASGPAPLGYGYFQGDVWQDTWVSFGSDFSNKYITTYFRRPFFVPDGSVYTNLVMNLLRDDGGVVYLNGTEVFRSNLREGPIGFVTLASSSASFPNDFLVAPVDPSLLVSGTNIMSVEIHQSSVGSADIIFDLELTGARDEPVLVPEITIADVTIPQSHTGEKSVLFTVRLSAPAITSVSVNFTTSDGTASAGTDYIATNGVLTFFPGQTSKTIAVTILPDPAYDPVETFFVVLSSPTNALISDPQGMASISYLTPLSILAQPQSHAIFRGSTVAFSVAVDGVSPLAYQWLFNGTNLIVNATNSWLLLTNAGPDRAGNYSVVVTGSPGAVTSQIATLTVLLEPVVTTTFTNTNRIQFGSSLGPLPPYPSAIQVSGVVGPVVKVTVRLQRVSRGLEALLVGPQGQSIVLTTGYQFLGPSPMEWTFDDLAEAMPRGSQFPAPFSVFKPTDHRLTNNFPFPAPARPYSHLLSDFIGRDPNGEWQLFTYEPSPEYVIVGDRDYVDLGSWSIDITHGISASIGDVVLSEGNSGPTNAVFTITLDGPSPEAATVNYTLTEGSATAGIDYTTTSGAMFFPPGVTTQNLAVAVHGDTAPEANEFYFVNLSNTNLALARGQAKCVILDDDQHPPNDHFASRAVFTGGSFSQTVVSVLATKEPTEPDHAGDTGGHSLWWSWTAPASGRVTIQTSGSTFDTLLAVYQGDALAELTHLVSNENHGGGPMSRISFNAVSNAPYHIAVDGRGGASGLIVLSLTLDENQFIYSDFPRDDFWIADGPIHAIVETNGVVIVGGQFNNLLPNRGTGLALDIPFNEPLRNFPTVKGIVCAVAADGQGGFYLGGEFSAVGTFGRTNLAHVRSDGNVDEDWEPPRVSAVGALALSGDALYVVAGSILALNIQTGGLLWNCRDNQVPNPVSAMVVAGETLYVGGSLSRYYGNDSYSRVPEIAALEARTGDRLQIRFPYETNQYGTGYAGEVRALAVSCDTLFAGGTYEGGNFRGLRAFDLTTGKVKPWDPGENVEVNGLALSGNTLYVAGSFTNLGGQPRRHLAALDANSGQATDWNPRPDGVVTELLLSGDTAFVWGTFTDIAGQIRESLAGVDVATGLTTDLNLAGVEHIGRVNALAVSGTTLYLGGTVLNARGFPRRNLAVLNARTGMPTAWNPGASGPVYALGIFGTNVYVGGSFTNLGGVPRRSLGSVHFTTGATTSWDPGSLGIVRCLALSDSTVFAGGDKFLTARDTVSGASIPWNPAPTGAVLTLSVSGELLYVGGSFSSIGGQARNGIAAIDIGTAAATAWNPNPPIAGPYYPSGFSLSSLAACEAKVYAGGAFTIIGGQHRGSIAALDPVLGFATRWDPLALNPSLSGPGSVVSLSIVDDVIYAGGYFGLFGKVGGPRRNGLAAVDRDTGLTTEWNPKLAESSITRALFVSPRAVYAGGSNSIQPIFAVFAREGAPEIAGQPRSQILPVGQKLHLEVHAVGQEPLFFQWQFNGADIPAATMPALELQNLQTNQSGSYAVVVSNGLGLIRSADVNVTASVPPEIQSQPVGQTVNVGTTVTFNVAASGSPPPKYQWRLNGVNIPGAIGPSLTIPNAQPTNGGNYSVVVANIGGAVISETAVLVVTSPVLPFADNLSNAGTRADSSAVGSGSNVGATKELGETNHVGKLGGRSVWLKWLAPANGIATFSTRGSSFDTLLAIYTGTNVADLTPVAADEDRGGFLTSRASFNAVAGTEYWIAVDGFAGATGNIVLSWSLDTSTVPFPRIITQPLSLSVFTGQTALFSVGVSSMTPVTYQWFRSCRPIAGATNATLTLTNVQRVDVGAYRVVIMNASSRLAESFEAFLEIGPEPKIVSQDKVEDLFPELLGPSGLFSLASIPNGFLAVSLGSIDSQLLDNSGATTSPAEPIHCGVLGGSSKWLRLRPLINATFLVDTMGSRISTVLAVYRETNLLNLAAGYVTCDLSSAPGGHSLVRFNATANTDYLVAVDGMNGAQGLISLNWKLGLAPGVLPPANGTPTVRNGESTVLQVTVTNIFGATYQWRWKGQNILGATNHTLSIPLVSRDNAGQYSIVASNFAGMTTNFLNLLVELPYLRSWPTLMNGSYRLLLPDIDAPPFILQASSDLTNWSSLYTIGPSNTVPHLDLPATNHLFQFFRARPWP